MAVLQKQLAIAPPFRRHVECPLSRGSKTMRTPTTSLKSKNEHWISYHQIARHRSPRVRPGLLGDPSHRPHHQRRP